MQNLHSSDGADRPSQYPEEHPDPFGAIANQIIERFTSSSHYATPQCQIRLGSVTSCMFATTGPVGRAGSAEGAEEDDLTFETRADMPISTPVLSTPLVEATITPRDLKKLAMPTEPQRKGTERTEAISKKEANFPADPLPSAAPEAARVQDLLQKAQIGKVLRTDPNTFSIPLLGQRLHERVSRIGKIYDTYLEEDRSADIQANTRTLPFGDQKTLFTYSHVFTNSLMKFTARIELEVTKSIDMLKVFAGLCEYDLSTNYMHAQSSCPPKQLRPKKVDEQSSILSGDMVWRVRREPKNGGKEDNIFHVSAIDALDETLGALLVAVYTPDVVSVGPGEISEDLTEICGIQLPKAEEGFVRVRDEKTFFVLRRTSERRFEVKCLMISRLSKAGQMFPDILAADWCKTLEQFQKFAIESRELRSRMHFSRHHDLYESIRSHLKRTPYKDVLHSTKEPMLEDWIDISTQVPEDWSDHNEDDFLQAQLFI